MTTQNSRVDIFGDKVIKEALALSPTTNSTRNDGYMVTIPNIGRDVGEEKTVVTKEEYKMPYDEKHPKLPEIGLGETAVTNRGLVKTPSLHNGGTISWPTQWGDNLMTSTAELLIRMKHATVK